MFYRGSGTPDDPSQLHTRLPRTESGGPRVSTRGEPFVGTSFAGVESPRLRPPAMNWAPKAAFEITGNRASPLPGINRAAA